MRLMKMLGLAAVAAVAAMAFIGVGTATAQTDEIVLCKDLVVNGSLCNEGRYLPSGTTVLALANEPKLLTSAGNVVCPDSVASVVTSASMGLTLPGTTKVEFGKLPTPELGGGCSLCTGGIHTGSYKSEVVEETVEKVDHWYLLVYEPKATLLNCLGLGITCLYGKSHIKVPIDLDATEHKALPENKFKGDLILFNEEPLEKLAGSGGFCPASGKWDASYTVIGCHNPETKNLEDCWLALYKNLA